MPAPYEWRTRHFQQAVVKGELRAAETWLRYVREQRGEFPQYLDPWFGDRERELFDRYLQLASVRGAVALYCDAKRIIEWSLNRDHVASRRRRLEEVSGLKYEDIREVEF